MAINEPAGLSRRTLIKTAAAVTLGGSTAAHGADVESIRIGEAVHTLFEPLIVSKSNLRSADESVGFLIGVTVRGRRHYFELGRVPVNGPDRIVPEDKVFFIGSNTKVFTATLAAHMELSNPFGLGYTLRTPVSDLLPANTTINLYQNNPILLWHLATHSSGFPDGPCAPHGYRKGDYTYKLTRQFLEDYTPIYAPGEYWFYSNQGFALLGLLVSHVLSGAPASRDWDLTYRNWTDYVTAEVVHKLGLRTTQVDYSALADRIMRGFQWREENSELKLAYAPPPVLLPDSAAMAAGALSSTLPDMLTFLEAQIEPPENKIGAAIRLTQTPYIHLSMGLAWQIGNGYFDKNGGLLSYNTYMAFDPNARIGVFVAGSTGGGNTGGDPGATLDSAGRNLLGALRGYDANPSSFPNPPEKPSCPAAAPGTFN